jgi:adenosylcobyric acid synthase
MSDKTTQQSQARINIQSVRGLLAHLQAQTLQTYQIHLGRTIPLDENRAQSGTYAVQIDTVGQDGWLSPDGWCMGCYLHGLFENDSFRNAVLTSLSERRGQEGVFAKLTTFDRQTEYDKLADIVRQHIDLQLLKTLCGL